MKKITSTNFSSGVYRGVEFIPALLDGCWIGVALVEDDNPDLEWFASRWWAFEITDVVPEPPADSFAPETPPLEPALDPNPDPTVPVKKGK